MNFNLKEERVRINFSDFFFLLFFSIFGVKKIRTSNIDVDSTFLYQLSHANYNFKSLNSIHF